MNQKLSKGLFDATNIRGCTIAFSSRVHIFRIQKVSSQPRLKDSQSYKYSVHVCTDPYETQPPVQIQSYPIIRECIDTIRVILSSIPAMLSPISPYTDQRKRLSIKEFGGIKAIDGAPGAESLLSSLKKYEKQEDKQLNIKPVKVGLLFDSSTSCGQNVIKSTKDEKDKKQQQQVDELETLSEREALLSSFYGISKQSSLQISSKISSSDSKGLEVISNQLDEFIVLSDHASPPPENASSPFVYWTLGAYGPSSQLTFTMSIERQSQSSSSGTGDKETPFMERVRRNVLRLPEFRIREILSNLKFQDTGLEPEDPDYEIKVQFISTVLINEDKEKQAKGAKLQASEGFIPLSQIEHDVRMA
ncbi:MAG: hypothetical protein EZS28_015939 [Streblomastix strix]|uniref:Uncharacterized protein n=1 Tax=Streblomastix strix TaxID=222440 RepID=A0A5J4W0Y5_9EUKA|nr:MAG: hypothetical protein EZS28_015939 [Streblomastix strix]